MYNLRPPTTLNEAKKKKKILVVESTLVVFFVCLVASMEKAMAPHSSTLAWKIPWMEESGGLQSMGSHRVGHD